jgi:hypothetical protein
VANLSSAVDTEEAATLRAAGVPVLEGTATGLAAFGHLFAYRDFLARSRPGSLDGAGPVDGAGGCGQSGAPRFRSATLPHRGTRRGSVALEAALNRWRVRLARGGRSSEAEGLALLADWGFRWWRRRWPADRTERWRRPHGSGGRWR